MNGHALSDLKGEGRKKKMRRSPNSKKKKKKERSTPPDENPLPVDRKRKKKASMAPSRKKKGEKGDKERGFLLVSTPQKKGPVAKTPQKRRRD